MLSMKLLTRDVDPIVENALNKVLNIKNINKMSLSDWQLYYDFIIISYQVSREKRYSISQLSILLAEKGCKKPGDLSILYAHGLYIINTFNDNKHVPFIV